MRIMRTSVATTHSEVMARAMNETRGHALLRTTSHRFTMCKRTNERPNYTPGRLC